MYDPHLETFLRVADAGSFNKAAEEAYITPSGKSLLKLIPVEWEHSIPYGLLHSPNPSESVAKLLEAARLSVIK